MADNSVPNDPRLVFNIAPVYGSTGWYFRGYGAFGNNQSNGASAQGGAVSTDSQGTLTFTPTETNVTGFGVVYLTGSTSGTFTWQAKQGASVIQSGSVNANGSTGLGRLDVTGLAAGTYSLVLTGPSGSRLSVAYLEAFCGSSGLLVDVIARQGARIADLVDNTTSPVQISSLASAFNIANAAPDMSIFNFLTNDFNWTPQTSLSSFNSNTLLAAQTAQAAGSDIGLANSIPVKARTLVAGELDQSAFSSALAAMAQANNFTFFDTHSRWGGGTNLYPAYSGLYIDNLHSTGVGHYDMASLIAQRLEV
jgi:lysophospholipase L1-like esterase